MKLVTEFKGLFYLSQKMSAVAQEPPPEPGLPLLEGLSLVPGSRQTGRVSESSSPHTRFFQTAGLVAETWRWL